ncbi:MAG: cadmium-translocating P-type ATPase [Elusimicrobia bacterium]|nr:cadmium-translocating P-type ATPase [Elusimicrobiota bacterium]
MIFERSRLRAAVALFSAAGILAYLVLKFLVPGLAAWAPVPLYAVAVLGGIPAAAGIAAKIARLEGSADVLALVSIVAALLMGRYLVAAILILMVSGGEALEDFAVKRASGVLEALSRRVPQNAHKKSGAVLIDEPVEAVQPGEILVVLPHEVCPVDGVVVEGHSRMDESYLTGEPYEMAKAPGSSVISGAINGETPLVIRATKPAKDSRYARIVKIMEEAESKKPSLRRLGDSLGMWYAPLSLALAVGAWIFSRSPERFLAVLVIATPCPLLIAIPVAVLGAISLAAKHSIIVKNPAALERLIRCRTVIFDKTGTLTYGRPVLTGISWAEGFSRPEVLQYAVSLDQYSKHPLSAAIVAAAKAENVLPLEAGQIDAKAGQGMRGVVKGRAARLTGRAHAQSLGLTLPPPEGGLECVLLVEERFAAAFSFHDEPRSESKSFLEHLKPFHGVGKVMMVSGDREAEVRYLAQSLGIDEIMAEKTPEEKVAIVSEEAKKADTLYVGDGINDAPALRAATVGVAFGTRSDVAGAAADAVVMASSLGKVDELIHISRRMRTVALESALGGMALSVIGMGLAARGLLPPLAGAVGQEVIDLLAVLNAVRVAWPPKVLTDY